MDVVLNEHTGTVHRRATGATGLHTVCGVTYHVDPEHLRRTSAARAARDGDLSKCGRCFEGEGGY